MAVDPQHDEIAAYAAAVRAALRDLPALEQEVLLEDLELHLAEVRAESDAPLLSRLGPPDEYARELRTAYGSTGPASRRRFPRFRRSIRAAVSAVSATQAYRAVRDYLPELRPAWWVLRAYLVVLALAVMLRGDQTVGPLPTPFTSGGLVEIIAMAVAIVLSIKIGRWSARGRGGTFWPLYAGNAVAGLTGLLALGTMSTIPNWVTFSAAGEQYGGPPYALGPVTNIYPYSLDGRPLDGVLLYDQNGSPVTIDASGYGIVTRYPTAADGRPVVNEYPLSQTTVDGTTILPPRVAVPSVTPTPSPSPSPSASPSATQTR